MNALRLKIPRGFGDASQVAEKSLGLLMLAHDHVLNHEVYAAHETLRFVWRLYGPHRRVMLRSLDALAACSPGSFHFRAGLFWIEYVSAHALVDELAGSFARRMMIALDGIEATAADPHRAALRLLRQELPRLEIDPERVRENLRLERRRMRQLSAHLRRQRHKSK